jgi:hypothetical protein
LLRTWVFIEVDPSQAAVKASKDGAPEVTLKHFEWAKVGFSTGFISKQLISMGEGSYCHGCGAQKSIHR